jgi:putative transposase
MSYGLELRERAVEYVRKGGSLSDACRIFGVHRQTLWRWLRAEDLRPKQVTRRQRKLDKVALEAHVKAQPDMLLRERAAHFGVRINSIWVALKTLKISKKNNALQGDLPSKSDDFFA